MNQVLVSKSELESIIGADAMRRAQPLPDGTYDLKSELQQFFTQGPVMQNFDLKSQIKQAVTDLISAIAEKRGMALGLRERRSSSPVPEPGADR
jgi:hypothetical protein